MNVFLWGTIVASVGAAIYAFILPGVQWWIFLSGLCGGTCAGILWINRV